MKLWGKSRRAGAVIGFAVAVTAVAGGAFQVSAQTRHDVETPSLTNGAPLQGVLFAPEGGGTNPGVLVLHTAYGKAEPADLEFAEALAKNGYVALAVNYMANAPAMWSPRVTGDLVGTVNWLRQRPEVGGKRVGAVGFSLGAHAILLAARHRAVPAVVVYYGAYNARKFVKRAAGIPPHIQMPVDVAAGVNAAVLLLHGEDDDEIPLQDPKEMKEALAAAGKTVELVTYPGAYHRFDRGNVPGRSGDSGPNGFTYRLDPDARKDAFDRTLKWFATYLRKPPAN